jgi:hypothetical protein
MSQHHGPNSSIRARRTSRPRRHRHRLRFDILEARQLLTTVNWISTSSGNWNTASNWSTGTVPGPSDDVVINVSGASPTVTIDSGPQSVRSLQCSDPLSLTGGSLALAAASEIDGSLTLSAGAFTTNAALTLTGSDSWTGSRLSVARGATLTNTGKITVDATGGPVLQGGGTLANASGGTLTLQGTGQLAVQGPGLTYQAGGTVELTGAAGITTSTGGTFNNAGTLQESAPSGTTTTLSLPFNNQSGTIDVQGGILEFAGGGTSTGGTFQVAQGATLALGAAGFGIGTLTGMYTGSGQGTITLTTSALTIGGVGATFAFPSGLFVWSGGTINFATGAALTNAGFLAIDTTTGNPLAANGRIVNSGTLNLLGAGKLILNDTTINNQGQATIDLLGDTALTSGPSNTFTMNNKGTITIVGANELASGTVTNSGTFDQKANTNLLLESIVLDNLASGLYDFQGGNNSVTGGSSNFVNEGTFRKSVGTGVSTWGGSNIFDHSGGTVDVETGTLNIQLNGHVSTGGTFNVAAGAVLDLSGPNIENNLPGTYTGSGAGFVEFNSGNLAFGSPANLPPENTTLDLTGGGFRWSGGTLIGSDSSSTFVNEGLFTIVTSAAAPLQFQAPTLTNTATIAMTGNGHLAFGVTTINNQAGAVIDVQSDAGISGSISTTLNNAGILRKSGGTRTSTIGTGAAVLENPGTIEADSLTISLAPRQLSQLSGTTLTAGTWEALNGSTIQFPTGNRLTTNQGSVTLGGAGASIPALANLASNAGSLSVVNGATFTTAGDLSNTGSLTLGPGSTLTVKGKYTQGSTCSSAATPPAAGSANGSAAERRRSTGRSRPRSWAVTSPPSAISSR